MIILASTYPFIIPNEELKLRCGRLVRGSGTNL